MFICAEEIQETENKVINYYRNLKTIQYYKIQVKNTTDRLESIQRDMKNSNIQWSSSTASIDYTKDIVIGSTTIFNGIDKQIDIAYKKLEDEQKGLQYDIMNYKEKIRKLEKENGKLEGILNLLNEESKQLIELKYKDNKSFEIISFQLKSSESSVRRKKDQILQDISRWFKVVC